MGAHNTLILHVEYAEHISCFRLFEDISLSAQAPIQFPHKHFLEGVKGNSQNGSVGGNVLYFHGNMNFCRQALLNQRFLKVICLIYPLFPLCDYL